MLKNKLYKKIIVIIGLILIIIFGLFLSTGGPRTDVYLVDYKVTGNTMTLNVGIMSSMGYIRSMRRTSGSMNYYLTFYSTFGINSSIGSKNTFEIELDQNVDEIYFYTGDKGYKKILEKNDDGEWINVSIKNRE